MQKLSMNLIVENMMKSKPKSIGECPFCGEVLYSAKSECGYPIIKCKKCGFAYQLSLRK